MHTRTHLIVEHHHACEHDLHRIAETDVRVDTVNYVHHRQNVQFGDLRVRKEFGHTRVGHQQRFDEAFANHRSSLSRAGRVDGLLDCRRLDFARPEPMRTRVQRALIR